MYLNFLIIFVRWVRNHKGPSLAMSLIGISIFLWGTISNLLYHKEDGSWVYQFIVLGGTIILGIVNWGRPLQRNEHNDIMREIKGFFDIMGIFGVVMLTTGLAIYGFQKDGQPEYFIRVGIGSLIPAVVWNIPWFFRLLFGRRNMPWKR